MASSLLTNLQHQRARPFCLAPGKRLQAVWMVRRPSGGMLLSRGLLSHRQAMHTPFRLVERLLCALALVLLFAGQLSAQEPAPPVPTLDQRVTDVESKVGDAALAGHNAWMLTSSALVLFMTEPGLALFYSGLVRKKNVLGVMMQCLFLMGLLTIIWGLYGYSLAFGGTNPYIGNGDYLLMKGVQR